MCHARKSKVTREEEEMGVQGLATYISKHKDYKFQDHVDLLAWSKQQGFGMIVILPYFLHNPSYISTLTIKFKSCYLLLELKQQE